MVSKHSSLGACLVAIKIILVVSCLALAECRKSNALLLNMMGGCTTIGCRLTALEADVNQLKQQVARLSPQPMNQAFNPYQGTNTLPQNQNSNQGGLNQGGVNQGGVNQGGVNQGGQGQGSLNQGGGNTPQGGGNTPQGGGNTPQDGGSQSVRASNFDYTQNQFLRRPSYQNGQFLRA